MGNIPYFIKIVLAELYLQIYKFSECNFPCYSCDTWICLLLAHRNFEICTEAGDQQIITTIVLHHWPWLALFYQEIYLMYVKILLTNYSNKSTLIPFAMQLHQLTSTEDPAHHVLQLKKRKEHNWVYQALSNLKNPYWNKVEKESLRTVCSSLVGFWLTAESGT